jgi:hypothetical protein
MITSGATSFLFSDGAVLVVSSVAGRCACTRSAFFFIGRNGKTHCLDCESRRFSEWDPTDDGPDAATAFHKGIV